MRMHQSNEKQREENMMTFQSGAYRDFTAHAVMEVERGELDRWFPSQQNFIAGQEVATVNLSSLAHETRAAWLTNLASPRPLALIGTTSPHGLRNLAPYTSLSVVSNSPPLAIVSFSADRNERWRDTLINLRETKKAVLNFLLHPKRLQRLLSKQHNTQPTNKRMG